MKRFLFIAILTFIFFLFEFVLFNSFGRWLKPNLLLLLVVYFNLAFGVRFSLVAALLAGLWKDSFTINVFGMNIIAFILCAYMTTFIKRYLFHMGSAGSRVLIVFGVTIFYCIALFVLNTLFSDVDFGQMFIYVLLPEVVLTTLLTNVIFKQLRKCVLKLSV